jgi:NAD+ kinase
MNLEADWGPMRVLIVTKITNYELHGLSTEAKVARGVVSKDALERLKSAHSEHYHTLKLLKLRLDEAGIDYGQISREKQRSPSDPDATVITIGGDGTMLAASHQMPFGGRLIGMKSSHSSVGYLCCVGPGDEDKLVQALIKGTVKTQAIPRLKAAIRRTESGNQVMTDTILNDFLYANANPAATTRYRLNYGTESELHRSSGIWIATGVGSTAAIFAAGGEKRPHTESLAQYRVRELYRLSNPPSNCDGGLFNPENETFEIENRCQDAILALDGQHGVEVLHYGDRVSFLPAHPIDLAKSIGN